MNIYRKFSIFNNDPLIVSAAVLSIFLVALAALELTNTTHFLNKQKPSKSPITAGQSTKGEKTTETSTPSKSEASSTDDGQTRTTKVSGAPSINLIDPTGNFVSAHKNVSSTALLSSTCNTTVGATCKIVFTSGDLTKSLHVQTTDNGGAAYWSSWTPASIGLTPGTWQVQAIASLDGKTKTGNDALSLEIKQ